MAPVTAVELVVAAFDEPLATDPPVWRVRALVGIVAVPVGATDGPPQRTKPVVPAPVAVARCATPQRRTIKFFPLPTGL